VSQEIVRIAQLECEVTQLKEQMSELLKEARELSAAIVAQSNAHGEALAEVCNKVLGRSAKWSKPLSAPQYAGGHK
jgi:F0F1-type ATP synthase membrane subunit b/b'